jgi:midasin (ATPase involved in ribosome maturation)
LAAVKAGHWVLLDELNLAGQSVLEGLNGLLDHRQALFVPELSQSFKAHQAFRLFAAQNPVQEGGGRKGLPKSFLNRSADGVAGCSCCSAGQYMSPSAVHVPPGHQERPA